MNPTLIHLARIECWQRAETNHVSLSEFLVLQILAAAGEGGMKSRPLATESRLHWDTVRQHLSSLRAKGFTTGVAIPRSSPHGRPFKSYSLTKLGRELMTPFPRARVERSAV